ncbi:uroporphyrinogen-III C-methyltransferase, putative chloroplast precursor [Ectocarpus siliculosus]|uniref:Uroporphyrinogen-III C-methyltransferase, putative chloroplast n=1 Tax=Ectocarpus siliculosus TaxID=2880 RepID=D8LR67_ECTSI|nr:uroporphyrinogen-III C-methyltransferase, putative chloroplast precursor [Ectocarpus siliculosus]|eukprot:CBN77740.1 uroporphyrinogen-III C-methyltransferase, putative chloroplast precursor [Ectocarpus siliculosus]
MTESTRRRRRPRALAAMLAVTLTCDGSASAFVPPPAGTLHSPFSSATAAAAAVAPAAGRASQQHPSQQRRGLLQGGYPRWSSSSSSSSSPLAGSAPAGGVVPTDHTDGWEPRDGVEIGTCSLVGSGPGDPDLLTVAGLRELQSADLVIADRLVSKEILGLVEGELRVARKYPGCAEQAQREIYRWMREGLSAGKHVVRLKIGDPFIFGRGGEEVLVMRELGVEPKVVPGISSVFSAPLLGGVPVTHRGVATQVTLGTGYGQDYARPDICDYHPQKTAVFLMAIGRLEELCADLVRRSYPTDTPVAIIENASTPRQRVIKGTVDTISKVARGLKVKAPATIVVGEVVSVLHGPEQGLLSDAAEGMFAGVDKERVASAAERVAEKKEGLFSGEAGEKVPVRRQA